MKQVKFLKHLFTLKGILVLALIVLIGWVAFFNGAVILKDSVASVFGKASVVSTGACPQDPTISPAFVSELYPATELTPTYRAKVNDGNIRVITSSTKFSKGDKVQLLVNNTGYISKIVYSKDAPLIIDCGVNTISGSLLSVVSFPTLQVIGTSNSVLTNAYGGGLVNETGGTTAPKTFNLRVTPNLYTGTGDLIVVVDANSSTKVGSITSTVATYEKGIPSKYQNTQSLAKVGVFRVSGSTGQLNVPFTLNPATGQSLAAISVNVTVYQAQDWFDNDGTFKNSMIEQSDGTMVYANMSSTAFAITA